VFVRCRSFGVVRSVSFVRCRSFVAVRSVLFVQRRTRAAARRRRTAVERLSPSADRPVAPVVTALSEPGDSARETVERRDLAQAASALDLRRGRLLRVLGRDSGFLDRRYR